MDNSEYLMHYGRKGMKWGEHIFGKIKTNKTVKKQRKDEAEKVDIAKRKEEIIKSRSAKQLYDNADLFTTNELFEAYNRLALEKKIKTLAPTEVSKGQKFIDKFDAMSKNVSKLTNAGVDLYNMTAKLYNTFTEDGKDNPWAQIKKREMAAQQAEAERRKQAKEAKREAKEAKQQVNETKKAEREVKKTEKETRKAEKDQQREAKKAEKESNKLNEYEIHTGKVEGDGTSRYTNTGKNWVNNKDYDIEIDFTNPSSNTQQNVAYGANYIAGLLEDLTSD